jgi:formate--tetrahydrofolate ligase
MELRVNETIARAARSLGLGQDELIGWGPTAAKITRAALARDRGRPTGKLIIVTAVNPTRFGEGKTVTTIGLGDALCAAGRRVAVNIRQPSLGPTFGAKGGGAGGGRARAAHAEDLNLHFTGDGHAIAAAHNLLGALVDAHVFHGNALGFAPHGVSWNRAVDVTDRALRHVLLGLGGPSSGIPRETGFEIAAASELMALVAMAEDPADVRRRLERVIVGVTKDGAAITAGDLKAAGALAVTLKDAMLPNLSVTAEGTPLLVHMGPFGNLATGHNSVIADRLALSLADVVVTEAGFGADLGYEKFVHLVVPRLGVAPSAAVVVATVRAVQAHATAGEDPLSRLESGVANLRAHLDVVRATGVRAVVAINRFPDDPPELVERLAALAREAGAVDAVVSDVFARGPEGGAELARAVEAVAADGPATIAPFYADEDRLEAKIEAVARRVYGAAGVRFDAAAREGLARTEAWGLGHLPPCMAKTPFSRSHDGKLVGAPEGFTVPVVAVEPAAGAGFVRVRTGSVLTMPGFGPEPAAMHMDLDADGEPIGVR